MQNEQGHPTPDELKSRWVTPIGRLFRAEILRQLQSEKTNHWIDWENLKVTDGEGKVHKWSEFECVERINNPEIYFIYNDKEEEHPRVTMTSEWADLRGIVFSEELHNAKLPFAHLDHAVLDWSHLDHADLRGSHLDHTDLFEAHLDHADLRGSHLEHANLSWSHLDHAILSGSHLDHADLYNAHLDHAILFGSNLNHSDLGSSNLEHANLGWSNLEHADLTDAHVTYKSWLWRLGFKSLEFFSPSILLLIILTGPLAIAYMPFSILWLALLFVFMYFNPRIEEPTILTGAELKNVKLDSDPVMYRKLLDEQYLDRFEKENPKLYTFWLLTSNCGRDVRLLLFLTLIIGIFFGLVFDDFSSPSWFPPFLKDFFPKSILSFIMKFQILGGIRIT